MVISILVGTILGFLTGLGTGGGSLLVLWLTLVLNMGAHQAKVINLLFFLPSAIISTVFRWRRGGIPFQKVWLPALSGCVAALIFATVGQKMNTELLQKLFGVLLIFAGIRELLYRERKPK